MTKKQRVLAAVVAAAVLCIGAYLLSSGTLRAPGPSNNPVATRAEQPPAEVAYIVAQAAETPFPVEYAGRVIGLRDVEVRAQVGGLVLTREYDEGTTVKQGQVLFRIDPAPYRAALSGAEAQLQQAQAALRAAEENFGRIEELFRRGVSTSKQRDDTRAARDQARAATQAAQAEVQAAELNLGYTTVVSPVSGVTSLQSPPVGSLILAQQTLLTTVTPLDPAYVAFSFTDEEGQTFAALNERREKPLTPEDLTAELQYGSGKTYPASGKIDTAAQRVDPQTGTIQARAIFPNPDAALLPGQFVRVRIRGVTLPGAIVVPTEAVSQGPQGPSVYVVGENETAQARPIRLGPELKSGWVVEDGLNTGDRVIVDGVIRVRPGAPVKAAPLNRDDRAAARSASPGQDAAGRRR